MAKNPSVDCVRACIVFVKDDLQFEESIIGIEQGQTEYSRNTMLFYKCEIATFENRSGNSPTNIRFRVVQVTSNSPHKASLADASKWIPF
jgi:hypothetical protein